MRPANEGPELDRDEQAALWCIDLMEGLDDARQCDFDRWHAESANAEAFQRAVAVWNITDLVGGTSEVVQMRSDALDAFRRGTSEREHRPRRPYLRTAALGAIASMAAAIVLLVLWSPTSRPQDFRTAVGERRIVMLDDGSRLSLDGDSEVEARFDDRRRTLVLSRGRALFDVAHDPSKPFTVEVGDKSVVATGTSFSVEALGGQARVNLVEGHVLVLDGDDAPVPLKADGRASGAAFKPGDELVMPLTRTGVAVVSPAEEEAGGGWQQGQISFDDLILPLAVERMNRYLAEPLVVGDAGAARVRVTGVFDSGDVEGFLEALRRLNGVRGERRSGKWFLSKT